MDARCTTGWFLLSTEETMKKEKKPPITQEPVRKPLRKVRELADGGLVLDDRDADESIYLPRPVAPKKVRAL